MKHLLFSILILLQIPLQGQSVLENQSYRDGSTIKIIAPIPIMPSSGFFPLRVEVKNNGSKPMSWALKSEARRSNYYYMGSRSNRDASIRSSFGVSCPPGEERVVELLIPVQTRGSSSYGAGGSVRITGDDNRKEARIFCSFDSNPSGTHHFGLSHKLHRRFNSVLTPHLRAASGGGHRYGNEEFAAAIWTDGLPQDWRAYAGYDALILSRQDAHALSPGVRSAIGQWMQSGGCFVVLNDGNPAPMEGLKDVPEIRGFGLMKIVESGKNYDDFTPSLLDSALNSLSSSGGESANDDYSNFSWKVGQELGARSLQTNLILLTLIVFAIVVGPVNLFVWANKHRRHRLFVTTPIISIITSLLLVLFIVIKDGFGGDGARAVAIDIGGPDDNSASIIQEQFSRSGILFSPSFDLDGESVLVPVPAPLTDFNRVDSIASLTAEINTTKEGWSVSGGLFQSRSEQAQVLRSVIPSRERLELVPGTTGKPQLVSSFSYPLGVVFYRDRDGEVWTAPSIAPGANVTLTSARLEQLEKQFDPTISRFGKTHQAVLTQLTKRKGSFSALAEKAPTISTHSSIDWKESPTLITGYLGQ